MYHLAFFSVFFLYFDIIILIFFSSTFWVATKMKLLRNFIKRSIFLNFILSFLLEKLTENLYLRKV